MGELDAFMEIEASVPELDARTDSRQPVQQMLLLIDEIVTYVSERTKGGYSGTHQHFPSLKPKLIVRR